MMGVTQTAWVGDGGHLIRANQEYFLIIRFDPEFYNYNVGPTYMDPHQCYQNGLVLSEWTGGMTEN